MSHTLTFATDIQATLFEQEICGQLSDGYWENTRPHNHWKAWCDAKILVGPNVGRDFLVVKTSYGLANKDLVDCVGVRMLAYARLCQEFGRSRVGEFDRFVSCDGWRGMPIYEGDYWDGIRNQARDLGPDLERARLTVENETKYTLTDLRRDLRAMSATMKIYRTLPAVTLPGVAE